ncbi:class I adenylate cyclase [Marinobacter zhejiangensis]|uniref:Adenylate cyclase n=1 Tax=Marinobacter zhejiangensis TaxID=488535 RepID=A0A1I4MEH0_9GAMM|nr:class I adenylate cyclase [Marinobacter zhejiangensis]SFM01395.1 adenylate cyclase [Marinobacter zhejiangensis]
MSRHSPAIAFDFDDGIDRKTLRRLRDRFVAVNRCRWERARSALAYRQQVVLDILPLVFHVNHPSLPGYFERDCPFGLNHYQPCDETLGAAQRLARTFRHRDSGKRPPDLTALFLMGSPGSLGHSVASDLDVWLCHRPDLPDRAVRLLERKADKVSEWAAVLGVELNIFVFSADDWRQGRQRAEVTGENCGSAQHYLLLDEFYRTGIHLGGSYPLWWLVPVEDEYRYDHCVKQLVECRFIRASEYIDFGAVPAIPPAEFLGAGVWQLYKGIDSPWKSILKLLLIECYARSPDQEPLALTFKAAVYRGETDPDVLDPYVQLYRRLETWLQEEPERLELVRRSLYLKAGFPLSRAGFTGELWRGRLLRALVDGWGWDGAALGFLDNRQGWRVEDVITLRRNVVGELTHSYRLLSRLARGDDQDSAISRGDLNLLGRKLYAVFQRKAGKVELINPNLAPSLAEENLSFYHQSEQGGNGDAWLLYRDLENPGDAYWQPVIRRSSSLAELVLWCQCNGLLNRSTRLNVRSGTTAASVAEARELLEVLDTNLPSPIGPPGREALEQPVRPLRILLLVNVGLDPQARFTERGLQKLSSRNDSLGFSGGRENLVRTIDQVTFNSWCEVSLQHYAAGDTLIQSLKHVLAAVAEDPRFPPKVVVHSHSPGHGQGIARRLQELFGDLVRQFFAGGRGPHPLRYVIEVDRRYFVLQFVGKDPGFTVVDGVAGLLDHLRRPQAEYAPVVVDRYALVDHGPLRCVFDNGEPGCVQVFYQVVGKRAHLWVLDETGSLYCWQREYSGRRYLLTPLLRFLDNLLERRQLRQALNGPLATTEVRCCELVARNGRWYAERRDFSADDIPLHGLQVQAVGVRDGEGKVCFDIYCDEQEFCAEEYGDRLIPAVAHYIHARRTSSEFYPVYLTDLHLPHDLDPEAYQPILQTTQYLHHCEQLEQALNRALRQQG